MPTIINANTDELVYLREIARQDKDFQKSDEIRNILDSRGSFVFDTKDGQVVYHLGIEYTRYYVNKNLDLIDKSFLK